MKVNYSFKVHSEFCGLSQIVVRPAGSGLKVIIGDLKQIQRH